MALEANRVIHVNPDDYEKIYIIGDIHGELKRLKEILYRIRPRYNDLVIFLGDYVDRGPDSFGCLSTVKGLQETRPKNFIALMGNHESMLTDYCDERYLARLWLASHRRVKPPADDLDDDEDDLDEDEGISPIGSHFGYSEAIKLTLLIKWAKKLPVLVKIGSATYASHAGYDFRKDDGKGPLDEVLKELNFDDFLWNRSEFYEDYNRPEKWYIGHTMVPCIKTGFVYPWIRKNNIVMMDTAATIKKGRLSCIEIKSGQVYQSSTNTTSYFEGW